MRRVPTIRSQPTGQECLGTVSIDSTGRVSGQIIYAQVRNELAHILQHYLPCQQNPTPLPRLTHLHPAAFWYEQCVPWVQHMVPHRVTTSCASGCD